MALYGLLFVRYPRVIMGRTVKYRALGFAYILVSAVTYDTPAHGEMLACGEPHDQKHVVL